MSVHRLPGTGGNCPWQIPLPSASQPGVVGRLVALASQPSSQRPPSCHGLGPGAQHLHLPAGSLDLMYLLPPNSLSLVPQPLPLLASTQEPSQSSELPSRQIPVPDPGVRVPQAKRAAGRQTEPVTPPTPKHTSLLSLDITNSSDASPGHQNGRGKCLPSPGQASEWGSTKPLLSTSCLWLQFPSCFHPPPPTPPHPYAPFNRHPLPLPSSFPPPLPGSRGPLPSWTS